MKSISYCRIGGSRINHAKRVTRTHTVQVVACPSANDALSILEQERRVDLVLTNIRMPGQLDGLQLAKIVFERWPALHIVVTSGNILSGDVLPPPKQCSCQNLGR
ncbi:response regulator [Pseudomonas sp. JUb42]|uniref:response regulator n=1 Tax=Pseudomonas sp. JUb42 TaxID=2940611 RepID=UPI0038F76A0A